MPNDRLSGWRKYLSLRTVLVAPFLLQMILVVAIVGFLSYRNGQQAVQSVAFRLCLEISDRIQQELETLLTAPHVVHESTAAAVELGHIDLRDLTGLREYFWQQVNILPNVKDIGMGNAQGEVVAASGAIGKGETRLSDATTDYSLEVYVVDPSGQPLTLRNRVPNFNPQERPWYQAAASAGQPTWTDIYPTFGELGLAISAVRPLYSEQEELEAVLYNLFHLSHIGDFLQTLEIGQTGQSFIIEPNGLLVATSTGEALLYERNADRERLQAIASSDAVTRSTSQHLLSQFGDFQSVPDSTQIRFQIDQRPYFLQVQTFQDGKGLDWIVAVVVPEADFMAQIYTSTRNTVLLCLLALAIAAIAGIVTARWITNPIAQVIKASNSMAEGRLSQRITATAPHETQQLAQAFNSMADRLNASFAELEAKNSDLQRMDQLKDEFLANTSHELRTPLNGMIGIAESMLAGATGNLSGEQTQNLTLLTQSGKRLVSLINDILDFAKLRHHELQLRLQPVSLREVVDVVLSLNRMMIGPKPLELHNHVAADLPLVQADENRLQQILHNLISNAIKFTPEGYVEVTAEVLDTDPAMVNVSVVDTGIGIPEDKYDRLFEAFEQVEGAADRRYGGTGLGLAITRNLVQLHGGTIAVASTPGRGSVFSFELPIHPRQTGVPVRAHLGVQIPVERPSNQSLSDRAVEHDRSFVAATAQTVLPSLTNTAPQVSAHTTTPQILVVDDEPVNLQVMRNFLKLQNYTLSFASDGPTALEKLDSGTIPDLILLDVMMPRMTGYEVVQMIRQHYPAEHLPIILLSARNQAKDIVLGLESGANDYLAKPINRDELMARIQTHLHIRQLVEETIQLTVAHERQLAQFLDALPVGVAVHRADGSLVYFNQAAKQILQTDLVQRPDTATLSDTYHVYQAGTENLYPTAELPGFLALQGKSVRRDDLEVHLEDAIIPLEVLGIPIMNAQGTIEYTITTFQNISERKQAEQILADYSRQLEQDVQHRTTELAQANQQLQAEIQERQRAERKLQVANQELQRLATVDGLTQVANRRYFDSQLQQEWKRLLREEQPLSLILFDVDYFKRYNDHYGHQAGDDCLVQIAQVARQSCQRTADLIARYGGEEFAVILPNTDQTGAITVAVRIRQSLQAQAIPHVQSEVSNIVSVSLGLASMIPMADTPPEVLIAAADQALYAAKRQGRDRYVVQHPGTDPESAQ